MATQWEHDVINILHESETTNRRTEKLIRGIAKLLAQRPYPSEHDLYLIEESKGELERAIETSKGANP